MNGTAKEIKGNSPSIRSAPDVSGAKVGSLPAGVTIEFMELVPGSKVATDKWLKLPNGIHFVNQNVGGVEYFKILTMPTTQPPPPVSESIYISHTFTDTLIVEKPDGSTQTYSATWTMPDVEYKPNP